MRIAFFDTKSYDIPAFEEYGGQNGMKFKFYETKLNEDTADLAKGCDAVCVFVNDTVNAAVIDKLCSLGIKMIALRCAGYNNVDLSYAKDRIVAARVPAYSPMQLQNTLWLCCSHLSPHPQGLYPHKGLQLLPQWAHRL